VKQSPRRRRRVTRDALGPPRPMSTNRQVPHPTVEERIAGGKAARAAVPLEAHAELSSARRRDPIEVLERQGRDRVQDLLPIRYERMLASPFAFYRGAAAIMAADLAATAGSGLRVQLCGDAHLANFGIFHSPERRLVFDLNDFDETLPGSFEWDVKRLAASVAVAGRLNGHSPTQRRAALLATVGSYRTTMRSFAKQGNLDVWYATAEVGSLLERLAPRMGAQSRDRSAALTQKARTRDHAGAMRKLTTVVDGTPRFVDDPPLIVPVDRLLTDDAARVVREGLHEVLRGYRRTLQDDRRKLLEQYRLVDIARKVVGVGSVGTQAFVLLLLGRDGTDPLILQAKEASASVLEPYCGRGVYSNAGQRVVAGQRLLQASSDIFLGWQRTRGLDGVYRDFYLRQLRDGKASPDVTAMAPRDLGLFGEVCAWTLARGHARSGDRVAVAAYLGKKAVFDHAIAEFAESYADLTEADHARLGEAVADGRIEAVGTSV
jgi:uncharacterized protein (DUF2252 family)